MAGNKVERSAVLEEIDKMLSEVFTPEVTKQLQKLRMVVSEMQEATTHVHVVTYHDSKTEQLYTNLYDYRTKAGAITARNKFQHAQHDGAPERRVVSNMVRKIYNVDPDGVITNGYVSGEKYR